MRGAGNVLIMGAGAIGSLLGGRLALAGHHVTMVGRPWLQEAVARDGLTIAADGERSTTRDIQVLTSTAEAFQTGQRYAYALLTPKAYSVTDAVGELQAATEEVPPVVTFQNGVGSEEMAAEMAGAERIIAATITIPVEMVEDAHISTISKGGIGLARWVPASPDPAPLATGLQEAGFRVELYDEPRAMKWTKLLLNMIGNATSAILGWPPQRIMADPRLYDVELDALVEAHRVMRALDIAIVGLPGYPTHLQFPLLEHLPRWLTRPVMRRMVARGRGGKMPSLYLGLEAGREESEVEVLNGAVVTAGEATAIATPVNDTLTRLVLDLARGERDRKTFYHNPEALLSVVNESRHAVA